MLAADTSPGQDSAGRGRVEADPVEVPLRVTISAGQGYAGGARLTGSERPASRPRGLFGRRDECEVLDGLLDQARDGHSAALVVRGEAGAGKTALLDYAVGGLRDADARALLEAVVRSPLDRRVMERIVAETRANPLALVELPRELSPAQLAGGFGLPEVLSAPDRIEDSFLRRIEELPERTRMLMVVAAADPTGDAVLVWRAAGRLGLGAEAARAAESAGLLEIGAQVRFRHPLVRSAVYRAAPRDDRQRAHRTLAEAIDPLVDPDRRAWHRAQAAADPDEDVAAELERSAGRDGPAPRADGVRLREQRGCIRAAVQGGPAAGATRSAAGPRDLPGCAGSRDIRRPAGRRGRAAGDRAGRASGACRAAAARLRPAPGRAGHLDHGRVRGGDARRATRGERLPRPRPRRRRAARTRPPG
jgi:hypothetical protein